jgi:hypothetical protein
MKRGEAAYAKMRIPTRLVNAEASGKKPAALLHSVKSRPIASLLCASWQLDLRASQCDALD